MSYCANCDVCLANKYGLWGRKRASKNWPRRIQIIFKKLCSGDGLTIRREKSNASI